MKYLSILAVASLALSPALAAAESHGNANKPKPGPLAGRALSGGAGAFPGAATAVLGLLVIGGVIVALSGSSDANNNTNRQNVNP